jgi:hypothetical protein
MVPVAAKLCTSLSFLLATFLCACGGGSQTAKCVAGVECFVPTGKMTVARFEPTATLLPSGLVLIAGGLDRRYAPLGSAELYDPGAGTFTANHSRPT